LHSYEGIAVTKERAIAPKGGGVEVEKLASPLRDIERGWPLGSTINRKTTSRGKNLEKWWRLSESEILVLAYDADLKNFFSSLQRAR